MSTKIKNKVIELLKNHKKIDVNWECGGDETLIYFTDNEFLEDDYSKYAEELSLLKNLMIDKLDLPNAGEVHNNGEGTILLNTNNQVILKHTFTEYYEEWYFKDYSENSPNYIKFKDVFNKYNNTKIKLNEKICDKPLHIKNGFTNIASSWSNYIIGVYLDHSITVRNLKPKEKEKINLHKDFEHILHNHLKKHLLQEFDEKMKEEFSSYDPTIYFDATIKENIFHIKNIKIHPLQEPIIDEAINRITTLF